MIKNFLFIVVFLCENLLSAQSLSTRSPDDGWRLFFLPADTPQPSTPGELMKLKLNSIPALVPGNVEIDLLAAGLIKDPEKGNNIYDLRQYEAFQWWYHRTFPTPHLSPGERVEIVFEGLDCYGKIWINDKFAGKTDNMLIDHRFDITGLLNKDKPNSIYVSIDPAVAEGRKYISTVIGTRGDFRPESVNIRKAPHMFGWDIMPRLISAGLWRDVRLDIIKPTRLKEIYWMTNNVDIPKGKAELILDWELATDYPTIDGLTMEVTLKYGSDIVYSNSFPLFYYSGRQKISLGNVKFWWPKGYGDPALYEGTLRITDDKKKILDEKSQVIGIRTAELIHSEITSPGKPGEFVFRINGEKIFVRGTNWVPLDALHSRDHKHLKDVFSMINDLNCNMIRCWGGNVYEDNEFFELCDRNGVMVWQDFAMGCTVYPQNDEFAAIIRNEAIKVVLKLRGHPSLVLWSGNNENDSSLEWTFSKHIDPGPERISREVLPRVIWEFDPLRDYLPSSPYSSQEYFLMGNNQDLLPEVHLWGPRGYYKAPFYTETKAHFVSEIGYHGCPDRTSLEKMFDPEFVYPWTSDGKWNDQWQTKAVRDHPKATIMDKRNDLMTNQVKAVFGDVPGDLDKFIFASQSVQGEAMKYFIELWRMDKFRKCGIIWWNLRDGWPIISDAIVDYYNNRKLAYYYIKNVQTNVCVMIGDTRDGKHPVVAVNDTRDAVSGSVEVRDADSGEILFSSSFDVAANGKTVIGQIPERPEQSMWLIDYSAQDEKHTNHYLNGAPPFKLDDYYHWYNKLNIKKEGTAFNNN